MEDTTTEATLMDAAFGNWLAGFIDGEGCFIIRETFTPSGRSGFYCGFSLEVRDDDAETIREIHQRTGVGTIKCRARPGKNGNDCPQISWNIQSGADCLALAAILDAHPLRAKKRRDYAIWRLAVDDQIANRGTPGRKRSGGYYEHIDRMRAYRDALTRTRTYGGEAAVVSAIEPSPQLRLVS